eukprot:14218303-Alexandrium_andersonii.AAC.1
MSRCKHQRASTEPACFGVSKRASSATSIRALPTRLARGWVLGGRGGGLQSRPRHGGFRLAQAGTGPCAGSSRSRRSRGRSPWQ